MANENVNRTDSDLLGGYITALPYLQAGLADPTLRADLPATVAFAAAFDDDDYQDFVIEFAGLVDEAGITGDILPVTSRVDAWANFARVITHPETGIDDTGFADESVQFLYSTLARL